MKTYSYKCVQCGKLFDLIKKRPGRKYCSEPCQYEASRKHEPPRLCDCGCGATITRKRYDKRRTGTYVLGHQARGDRNVNWNNGRSRIGSAGYLGILQPDHPNANARGYVPEHVFVMSEHLGRAIKKGEVVHHKNEIITDNRLENLQLMTVAEHLTHHHKGRIKPNSVKNLAIGQQRRGYTQSNPRSLANLKLRQQRGVKRR